MTWGYSRRGGGGRSGGIRAGWNCEGIRRLSDLAGFTEEQRFQLLVNAVIDYAIYMLDPEGRIATWNPGAERFKGYKADEIIGEHFSRFFSEEDRAADLPGRALRIAARDARRAGADRDRRAAAGSPPLSRARSRVDPPP